jgi:uncharacterized protein
MALDARLLGILACPVDLGPLWYFAVDALLYNPRLRRKYPVEDDIPQLLEEDGAPVDEAEHQRLMARAGALGVGPNFSEPPPP